MRFGKGISLCLFSCLESEQEKKKEVERQTQEVLEGQTHLSSTRKKLRDLQEKLVDLQESKKAAVTGNTCVCVCV